MIAIFGGGEIAGEGIVPLLGDCVVFGAGQVDVRDADAVHKAVQECAPDVVIYTAGVSSPAALTDSDPAAWREEIDVNLIGAYHVARALSLTAKTLIVISSLAGLYGKPNHSGYAAAKAGLISLVQSLALEGHNAYAISPGRVNTRMRERDYPGEDPRTRLGPRAIGEIVCDIIAGRYEPGDNIVIRMRGHETLPIEIHRGDGWRERLRAPRY